MTFPSEIVLHPLNELLTRQNFQLPGYHVVLEYDLPETTRAVLVHEENVYTKLKEYFDSTISAHRLFQEVREGVLLSEIVLKTDTSDLPVAYCAVEVFLYTVNPSVAVEVQEVRAPLGEILRDCGVDHRNTPMAYLCLQATREMARAIGTTEGQQLFGRRNQIFSTDGTLIANMVEVLRP